MDETTGKPIVTKEQVEHARHVLVGRSKPFTSPSVPEIPAVSSSENSADNPSTFATQNVRKEDETESTVTPQSAPEHTDEKEEDNEMQVDYTMDESDEDTIIREELQIADDSLPEVSPSSILARDIIRVNGWHRNDDALDEESETEVHETLQAIRGTELMEYMKEAALGQEQDHQRLLAAIRKAEEAELEESNISSSPDSETDSNVESCNNDVTEDDERPLSYYL
ncbi:conserved domain protein [Prevotella denticola CRIS 18C-A]|uniref:Conserved domain protein n=1 Tax=Prevotella denticola CRIS 18C-A TaxID=944557 RepID=F0H8A9_9BACT|nr:conserved domain protein [Prevotella denticola CRIS 18C-A]